MITELVQGTRFPAPDGGKGRYLHLWLYLCRKLCSEGGIQCTTTTSLQSLTRRLYDCIRSFNASKRFKHLPLTGRCAVSFGMETSFLAHLWLKGVPCLCPLARPYDSAARSQIFPYKPTAHSFSARFCLCLLHPVSSAKFYTARPYLLLTRLPIQPPLTTQITPYLNTRIPSFIGKSSSMLYQFFPPSYPFS